ncbi:type II secretion system protein [Nautilia sp.]
MKKSFTLIELLLVIMIMGILGTISIEILQNTYKNYVKTRELNKLALKTDLTLNIIAAKLRNRIKNSVIAVKCNTSDGSCLTYANKEFISVNEINSSNSSLYPVLEWLYVSYYSKRGMWNESENYVQPGWSGFVDLKLTRPYPSGDEYNITTPESNFTVVNAVDQAWIDEWNVSGSGNVFNDKFDVLVFSGSDGRGDFEDINNSYGYYDTNASRVFEINATSDTNLTVKAITESNSTTVYEGYYIVRGAMAIVPVYDDKYKDYNLTLRFNYFPWNVSVNSDRTSADPNPNPHQMYMEGNSTLLASHVTQFKFKEQGGVMRIYLCITSPQVKLSDYNLTLCKEKVVF